MHIVVTGRVKIFVLSPESGREIILTTEHPYNAVAELPSFDGGAYPASAEALEESETLMLEQHAFEAGVDVTKTPAKVLWFKGKIEPKEVLELID